jgi:uncharacterized protein
VAAGSAGVRTAAGLLAALLQVAAAAAQTSVTPSTPAPIAAPAAPPAPVDHFTDYAGFVAPATAQRLNARLQGYEAQTGHQFVVVIFKEMPVLDPPADSLRIFTLRTADAWGVGRKGADDGVVLFVFVKEHKLRLEVGRGLGLVLTNEVCQRIVDEKITPALLRGDRDEALEAGIEAVIAVLGTEPAPRPSPSS